jgi:prepilin-type processing-associated H-X9-DG protein
MPINYTCPHCGVTTDVADDYAGQSGPCAQCGKMITVPMPAGGSPFLGGGVPQKRGMGTGSIIAIVLAVVLVVALVCGGILVAPVLLLPGVQAAREAARRTACTNNMKQIALAMHSYAQKYKSFPPAYIADKNGKPMHSWRVLILPFMEEDSLYRDYRFDEPWDSPHNRTLAARMPRVYACPSDSPTGTPNTHTDYAMIVGPHTISDGPTAHRLSDFTDGTSNTIMVVEATGAGINWMEPRDLKAEGMQFCINGGPYGNPNAKLSEISSPHSGGANVALCDGSVHFISSSIDPKILKAMITIDGGEAITLPDY